MKSPPSPGVCLLLSVTHTPGKSSLEQHIQKKREKGLFGIRFLCGLESLLLLSKLKMA